MKKCYMIVLSKKYINDSNSITFIRGVYMKIGFIDSGLGGVKVLKTALELGLSGNIYLLCDLKNNPYGEKDDNYIKSITLKNVELLVSIGCEIVVIACNTATAIAIDEVRKLYPKIKIFGIEPAIKSVVNSTKKGIVLGTKVTLKGKKLSNLIDKFKLKDKLILIPANELVKLIENDASNTIIENYLENILSKYDLDEISHIVLGCTHYPLVLNSIINVVNKHNPNIEIIDGSICLINNVLKNTKPTNSNSITLILTLKSNTFVKNAKKILNVPIKVDYK